MQSIASPMASNYETSQIFGTVLALDVFESTVLTLQYGDVVTVRMNQDFDEFLKIAKEFDGELADRRGDGLRLVFKDATKALFAAYRMQISAGFRNSNIGTDDPKVTHRIGLFFGEITTLRRPGRTTPFTMAKRSSGRPASKRSAYRAKFSCRKACTTRYEGTCRLSCETSVLTASKTWGT